MDSAWLISTILGGLTGFLIVVGIVWLVDRFL